MKNLLVPILGMAIGAWFYTVPGFRGWAMLLICIAWLIGVFNLSTSYITRKKNSNAS